GPSLTVKGAGTMPSVPQSLLWISLVVLWLFVLVPMLVSKRDAVRRTSDVALATRVLNGGLAARKLKKGGPAAGHRSDPDWKPIDQDDVDLEDDGEPSDKAVVVKAAEPVPEEKYLDVDVVEEDSGALPVGASDAVESAEPEAEPEAETEPVAEAEPEAETDVEEATAAADEDDGTADEYEYVEDTSGLDSADEPATASPPVSPRRRAYESKTAALVSARKYRFRKRVLSVMVLILLGTTAAAVTVWPEGWWACGSAGLITTMYLGYLRRQTRIEEQIRRRR